ncbi:hypothetical protein BGZ61DRAFT_536404 [Ilyonectria robusta]|uniref:uncharacterized protein n=1 Tax=Ilyonectria robusta TaxID=1079257 RepID=UPI001E8CF2FE|nr:uncharacterized protein BGZ61DRAFT_536404 [Ilyonectria robusta]KAH8675119.1 hypothetical protein BGZ61DRAFT_536404 [Ilyonectria robusta]
MEPLQLGNIPLLSYEAPSLPGETDLDINQRANGPSDAANTLHTTKTFAAQGTSQFALPENSVRSFYPAQGEAVENRVLPHVVLNDPLIPWERDANNDQTLTGILGSDARVPWLALLVFTADELQDVPTLNSPTELSPTRAATLTQQQLFESHTGDTRLRVPFSRSDLEKDENVNVIFVKASAFNAYFSEQVPGEKTPAIGRYSLLSHVRRSAQGEGPEADSCGVVIGHRHGPADTTNPTLAVAHLVSLIGVQSDHMAFPAQADDVSVLVSLHSWSFQWTPSEKVELVQHLKNLINNIRPLARSEAALGNPQTKPIDSPRAAWMKTLFANGYTTVNHRLVTGELTAAMYRGPLIPNRPRRTEASAIEPQSREVNLQRFDAKSDLMDISYQVAWNVGRELALENSTFVVEISRLRRDILTWLDPAWKPLALPATQADDATKPDWLSDLSRAVKETQNPLSSSRPETSPAVRSRWRVSTGTAVEGETKTAIPSTNLTRGQQWLDSMVTSLAQKTINPNSSTHEEPLAKVIEFVTENLLSLKGVPLAHLFPEPNLLLDDAILIFSVDPDWIVALVDGALSIGNTQDSDNTAKLEMRRAINTFLTARRAAAGNGGGSGAATWGICVCGKLPSMFPELRVRASNILLTKRIHDSCLLVIFDSYPEDLANGISLIPSPNQQRFVAATLLTESTISINMAPMPTRESIPDTDKNPPLVMTDETSPTIYSFQTRCLHMWNIRNNYTTYATKHLPDDSFSSKGSAASLALAFSDKLLQLDLKLTDTLVDASKAPNPTFQLCEVSRLTEIPIQDGTRP